MGKNKNEINFKSVPVITAGDISTLFDELKSKGIDPEKLERIGFAAFTKAKRSDTELTVMELIEGGTTYFYYSTGFELGVIRMDLIAAVNKFLGAHHRFLAHAHYAASEPESMCGDLYHFASQPETQGKIK